MPGYFQRYEKKVVTWQNPPISNTLTYENKSYINIDAARTRLYYTEDEFKSMKQDYYTVCDYYNDNNIKADTEINTNESAFFTYRSRIAVAHVVKGKSLREEVSVDEAYEDVEKRMKMDSILQVDEDEHYRYRYPIGGAVQDIKGRAVQLKHKKDHQYWEEDDDNDKEEGEIREEHIVSNASTGRDDKGKGSSKSKSASKKSGGYPDAVANRKTDIEQDEQPYLTTDNNSSNDSSNVMIQPPSWSKLALASSSRNENTTKNIKNSASSLLSELFPTTKKTDRRTREQKEVSRRPPLLWKSRSTNKGNSSDKENKHPYSSHNKKKASSSHSSASASESASASTSTSTSLSATTSVSLRSPVATPSTTTTESTCPTSSKTSAVPSPSPFFSSSSSPTNTKLRYRRTDDADTNMKKKKLSPKSLSTSTTSTDATSCLSVNSQTNLRPPDSGSVAVAVSNKGSSSTIAGDNISAAAGEDQNIVPSQLHARRTVNSIFNNNNKSEDPRSKEEDGNANNNNNDDDDDDDTFEDLDIVAIEQAGPVMNVEQVVIVMKELQRLAFEYNFDLVYDPASREQHRLPISFVMALFKMIKDPHQCFASISKACLSLRILDHFMDLLPNLMMMTNVIDLEGTDEADDNRTTIKDQRKFGGILMNIIIEMMRNEKLGKQLITYLKSHLEKVFLLDDSKGGYKDATTRDVVAMGLFLGLTTNLELHPNIGDKYLGDTIDLLDQLHGKIENPKFGEEGAAVAIGRLIDTSKKEEHKLILYKINTHICALYIEANAVDETSDNEEEKEGGEEEEKEEDNEDGDDDDDDDDEDAY